MFLEGRIKVFGRSLRLLFFPLRKFLRAQEGPGGREMGSERGWKFLTLEMCTSGAWRGGEGGRCAATGCGSGGWAL